MAGGNPAKQRQDHDSAVDLQSTPAVQYTHSDGVHDGNAAYLRLGQTTYPDGQEIEYNDDDGPPAAVDKIMSRLGSIRDNQNDTTSSTPPSRIASAERSAETLRTVF